MKVVIIHGNGGGTPQDNWIPYIKKELIALGIETQSPQFPDATLARSAYWLPFLKDHLKCDHNTILIGHSSGAVAAMRFAEKHSLLGSILVGAYYTDLGYENEKQSGYFDHPWDFDAICKHQKWIVQFASTDDPWIPIEEPRYIHAMLHTEYHEYTNQGHFGGDYDKKTFKEMIDILKVKLHAPKTE